MNYQEWINNDKPMFTALNGETVELTQSDIRVILDDTGFASVYFKINGITNKTFGICEDMGNVVYTANVSLGHYELSHTTFFRMIG